MRIRVTQIQSPNSCYYTHRFADDYMDHYRRKVILSGIALKKVHGNVEGPFEDTKFGKYKVESWELSEDKFWAWYAYNLVTEWQCLSGDITFTIDGKCKIEVIKTLKDNPCPGELVPQLFIEQNNVLSCYGYLTNATEIKVEPEIPCNKDDYLEGSLQFDVNDPAAWKGGQLPESYLLGYPVNGHPIQSDADQAPNTRTFQPVQNWFTNNFLHNPNHRGK